MQIVEIKEEHLPGCAELYRKVFNAEPWYDQWTPDTAYKRISDLYHSLNFVGMACLDGGKVKAAALGYYEQFYDGTNYILKELYVSDEARGRELGSLVIQKLEEKLRALGVSSIILLTSRENEIKRFYFKNHYNEWNSMMIMGKIL